MKYTEQYYQDLEDIQGCIPGIGRLQGSRLFITGGTGLIGSAAADFLMRLNDTRGYGIHIYIGARSREKAQKRFGAALSREDVSLVPYEALGPFAPEGRMDFLIHAAGPADPTMYADHPVETMLSHFLGLGRVLEYAAAGGAGRVVYISSSEVYGKGKDRGVPYQEGDYGYVDLLSARSCYPAAKRAAETLCASYVEEYGTDIVTVRPGHGYGAGAGAGDSRAASQFLRDAARGKDIVMKSSGAQTRSYCHVCDCVSAIFTAALEGERGRAYNISNPDSVCTIRELAECIARTGGCRILCDIPTQREKGSFNPMDNSSLDSTALQALGWRGMFDLETGISRVMEMLAVE